MKVKKPIFLSLISIFLVLALIFIYFWTNWFVNSKKYLNQTELYYNMLVNATDKIPSYELFNQKKHNIYTIYPISVYDRNNKLIGTIKTNNKIIVPLKKISVNFLHALIATEDRKFYTHEGISFVGISRAFFNDVKSLKIVQGGSTITQQLAKLLFSNQEKTFRRKFNEFFNSLAIEKNYTKEDILFMYSNLIYLGHNIYGVGLASKAYFGKDVSDLSLAEGSLLVSLISNPYFYDPYRHPENNKKKHLAVLLNMVNFGFITKEEAIKAFKDFWKKPTLLKKIHINNSDLKENKAPYVLEQVKRFLRNHYGKEYVDKFQGSKIYTTIDLNLQEYGKKYNQQHLRKVRTESDLSKKDQKNIQSAYIISNPSNGEILSFRGGMEYSVNDQFNRVFQAKRQVGSTIKPFLYMVGLNLGKITPYTVFEDVPIEVEFKDKSIWEVNNYAKSYRGFLNVTDALRRSSNVVAVQAANTIGLENLQQFFKRALSLDYTKVQHMFSDYQYSVVLGAVEMTPFQLEQLYQIIANEGTLIPLHFISEIRSIKNHIIFQNSLKSTKIISKEAAFLMKIILKQVLSKGGSGNHVQRLYNFKDDLGVKSGTTQKNRDVWFAGFTNSLLTTVWIGQDNDKPLGKKFVGGVQAGEMFGGLMSEALKSYPTTPFKADRTYNFIKAPVDLLTGLKPNNNSLFKAEGIFIKGTEPNNLSSLSYQDQIKIALEKKLINKKQSGQLKQKYIKEVASKEESKEKEEKSFSDTDSKKVFDKFEGNTSEKTNDKNDKNQELALPTNNEIKKNFN